MRRLHAALIVMLLLVSLGASAPNAARAQERENVCAWLSMTCVTLTVPLDHFNPDDERTIDVNFGVMRAVGERKGTLVVATGGPGSSGLVDGLPQLWLGTDAGVERQYDVVFFDQRGVGTSGRFACADATTGFYLTEQLGTASLDQRGLSRATQTFVRECTDELPPVDELAFYGTDQAVEDLEDFRDYLGVEMLWLWGVSYGTSYVQTYAAAHPDRIAGLILDGPIDPVLSGPELLAEQAKTYEAVLIETLNSCTADPDCGPAAGGDALSTYDRLAADLAAGPLEFAYPLATGRSVARSLTRDDLAQVTWFMLDNELGRQLLQRIVAAVGQGNLVPLDRLAYYLRGLDPETMEPFDGFSDDAAGYLAVWCNDYGFYEGTPAQRAAQYHADAADVIARYPRGGFTYYMDFPCAYWPTAGAATRPVVGRLPSVPVLILAATADVRTPYANAVRLLDRYDNAFLVTVEGGHHGLLSTDDGCGRTAASALLLLDSMPGRRETTCPGRLAESFVPVAPRDAETFARPLEALLSFEAEVGAVLDWGIWDTYRLRIGCDRGGALTMVSTDDEDRFSFKACTFSDGFVVDGLGAFSYETGTMTLIVDVAGDADGHLQFEHTIDGAVTVTGTYDGERIDPVREVPEP